MYKGVVGALGSAVANWLSILPGEKVPGLTGRRGLNAEVLAVLKGIPLGNASRRSTPREVWGNGAASGLLQAEQDLRILEIARADAVSV